MLQTFNCPSCSGPLEYRRKAGKVIRCTFCGQSVIVPEQAEGATAEMAPPSSGRSMLLAGLVLLVAGLGGAMFFLLQPSPPSASSPPVSQTPPPPPTPTPPPTEATPTTLPATASFRVVRSFGEEGIGPGHFDDARHITLDSEGYLYVGEYSSGRIQRFDSTGQFITQWLVNTEAVLRGLAADRQGIVYAVQRGQIHRYQGATGEALGTMTVQPPVRFDGVYPALDGGLLAYGGFPEGQILRLDAQHQVQLNFETQARQIRAALDGLGNIYALGRFSERGSQSEAVFRYDVEGTFTNRFGSTGTEPGQFRAPHAIAVDGRGRVYVGIQVFGTDGRFLAHLDLGPSIFGMAFNDKDELYIVERNSHRVMKVILSLKES